MPFVIWIHKGSVYFFQCYIFNLSSLKIICILNIDVYWLGPERMTNLFPEDNRNWTVMACF